MRVIRLVRPKFVVLENVAAILNNGLDIVLGELAQAGYDAEWSIISASSLGACHRRSRWWLVAYPNGFRCGGRSSERCSVQERQIFSGEQKGSEMGGETERCSSLFTDTNNNGSPSSSINRINVKQTQVHRKGRTKLANLREALNSSDSGIVQQFAKPTDSNSKRLQRPNFSEMEREIWSKSTSRCLNPDWRSYVSKPILRREMMGYPIGWTELKPSEIQ